MRGQWPVVRGQGSVVSCLSPWLAAKDEIDCADYFCRVGARRAVPLIEVWPFAVIRATRKGWAITKN